jgi:hypothetical protein
MAERILPTDEDQADRPANEDRRAAVRRRTTLWVACREATEEGAGRWRARLLDVSPLGVGLLLARALEPSTLLRVELENPARGLSRHVLARVVHVQQNPGSAWLVGCAFAKELDDVSLRLLRAERVRPASGDARRWVRFPCNVETVCQTCETAPGERHPARILNVSPGGVGLLLPCEFAEGTLLYFELPAEGDQEPRKALVRVIRALQHGTAGWFLGCEFADQLSERELLSLVG